MITGLTCITSFIYAITSRLSPGYTCPAKCVSTVNTLFTHIKRSKKNGWAIKTTEYPLCPMAPSSTLATRLPRCPVRNGGRLGCPGQARWCTGAGTALRDNQVFKISDLRSITCILMLSSPSSAVDSGIRPAIAFKPSPWFFTAPESLKRNCVIIVNVYRGVMKKTVRWCKSASEQEWEKRRAGELEG